MITERIEYKLLSLTYKVPTTTQPSCLQNHITVQPPRSTRSSSLVTLGRPSTSCLRITDRSLQYAYPRLWNQLSASHRQPRTNLSNSASPVLWVALPPSVPSTHHFHHPLPLYSSTPGLKLSFSTNPSQRSLPFLLPDWLHGFPGLFTDTFEHISFYSVVLLCTLPVFLVFRYSTVVVPCCGRLIWLM